MSLKTDVLRYMQDHAHARASLRGTTVVDTNVREMAHIFKTDYQSVADVCWSLQKQGFLKFNTTKKRTGETYLARIRLTEAGMVRDDTAERIKKRWDSNATSLSPVNGLYMDPVPGWKRDEVKAVVRDITDEGKGFHMQGTLSPIGRTKLSDNVVKPQGTHRRHMVDPTEPSAHASVAVGGEVTVTRPPQPTDLITEEVKAAPEAFAEESPLEGLTAIREVMERDAKRQAAQTAFDALVEAGLTDLAEAVMARVPAYSELEREVMTLLERLGLR